MSGLSPNGAAVNSQGRRASNTGPKKDEPQRGGSASYRATVAPPFAPLGLKPDIWTVFTAGAEASLAIDCRPVGAKTGLPPRWG